MAGRGRGRGRGGRGFGGGFTFARQVEFVLFPEDVDLPKVKIDEIDPNMKKMLRWGDKFQNYWKASSYFLEETTSKGDESQSMHIARYSDKKKTMFTRDSLSQILVFDGFAKELVQGKSGLMRSQKKFRWNPESELKRIEFLEQQEKKGQGRGDKGEEEKKDDEDEDEIGEDGEASDEDEIGDEDYIQGEYYDDNEDDYNDVDVGDDEGTY